MIHWKDCDIDVLPARCKHWRRNVCRWEIGDDGTCNGVGRSRDDDELHDICKVCDRLRDDAPSIDEPDAIRNGFEDDGLLRGDW